MLNYTSFRADNTKVTFLADQRFFVRLKMKTEFLISIADRGYLRMQLRTVFNFRNTSFKPSARCLLVDRKKGLIVSEHHLELLDRNLYLNNRYTIYHKTPVKT